MLESLNASNLGAVSRGCRLLAAGGGGDTDLPLLMALRAVEENGPVPVVGLDDLPDDALVMPCGMIGAPGVADERLWSGDEGRVLRDTVEGRRAQRVDALMCFEIGGANGLLPVTWASRLGIPVVDADGMGRAFAELYRQTMNLAGIPAAPVVLTDGLGNTLVLETADDRWADRLARRGAGDLGGVCAGALYCMTAVEARGAAIAGSLSRALALGGAIETPGVVLLAAGRVVDVDRCAVAAGSATIRDSGEGTGRQLRLEMQNEFLLAIEDGAVRAAVPDVISVLAATDGGSPIASERLAFGERVAIVALPAPEVWLSQAGLSLVGPRAFGYDVDYSPIAASEGADVRA